MAAIVQNRTLQKIFADCVTIGELRTMIEATCFSEKIAKTSLLNT